ncbi:MAG: phosphatidylinositol mannoside acyltransferase [Acidimicrobiia bacterium]
MATARNVKDWLTYILFRIAAALFGALPEQAVRSLGTKAGAIASARNTANRPLLARHMRRVLGPGASEAEVQAAVNDMYRSYGRYWAETFWFRPRRRDAILASVERIHFDPVHEAKAEGRGIVFAVSHVGNWEIAGLAAEDLDLNLLAVAENLPNPKITDWFLDVRARFGMDVVLTSDPARRSKMIRRLKAGGALALLADRDITGKGVPVVFFGEETTLPAGPAALAELTDSVLLPVVVYFKDGPGYRLEVGDPIEIPDAGTRADRVQLGAQAVAEALETHIRKHPSQWHLFQPNWPSDTEPLLPRGRA